MQQADRKQLEDAARQGNELALRLLLNDALANDDRQCIDELLADLCPPEFQALLRAEFACFHGVGDEPWQEQLIAACHAGDGNARFIAALYHDWAGFDEAATTLRDAVSSPVQLPRAGHGLWSDGWDHWQPPAWETLVEKDGVSVSRSERFVSAAVASFVVRLLAPRLAPSAVVDPGSGKPVAHPARHNLAAQWLPELLGWFGKLMEQRLAAAAGFEVGHGEVPSLLCYRPGHEYRPHYDCISTAQAESEAGRAQGGQRRLTVLLDLGGAALDGGDTEFPRLGLSLRTGNGRLLRFNNADDADRPLPASLHRGTPVRRGEKWLLSKWVRAGRTPYGREIRLD